MIKKQILTLIASLAISISSAQDSMNVSLLFQWNDTSLPSSSIHDNRYNEIWGVAINGREYAIIGSTMGTHIFDVTDPNNVDTVAFVPGAVQGSQIIHRDYHDYNGYLYIVADEGSSTLQIADLNYLPDSVVIVYDSDALFSKSHNIFIDTATARLYVCAVRPSFNDIEVYSLTDPVNPQFLTAYDMNSFTHDIYVKNDTAYINDGNSGLFVVDFTNVSTPQLIGSLTSYLQKGYNHSGWLSEDGTIYAMADETFGLDIKMLDVSDLSNISVLDTIGSDVHPLSIPHNLIIKDNFLFVSYYNDGLYIFDISNPGSPVITGYYDTSTEPHVQGNYRGAWGVYPLLPSGIVLISDMQNGLFVFDASQAVVVEATQDSLNVTLLYNWDDTTIFRYNEVWGFVQGGREYAVIGSFGGTHIFDVTDPVNSTQVEYIPGANNFSIWRDYHNYNGYLYMVSDDATSTLQIADLNYLPDSVVVVYDSNSLFSRSHNIFIDTISARLYTCGGDNNNGIRVFSLADPVNPVELVNFVTTETTHDIYVRNDTAFVNNGNSGLFVYDFTNVTNPQLLGSLTSYPHQGYNHSGWLNGDGTIYALADETNGKDIKICDVSNLSVITVIDTVNSGGDPLSIPHNLIIRGNYLYASYYKDGLYIYDISDPGNTLVTGYYDTDPDNINGAWGVYPLLPSGIVLVSDIKNGLFIFDVSAALIATQSLKEKEEDYNTISVFPNPFSESITVLLPDNFNSDLTFKLFDMLGRTILSETKLPSNSNKYIIKTDDLPGGIYILEVRCEEIIHHQKIIKAAIDK